MRVARPLVLQGVQGLGLGRLTEIHLSAEHCLMCCVGCWACWIRPAHGVVLP